MEDERSFEVDYRNLFSVIVIIILTIFLIPLGLLIIAAEFSGQMRPFSGIIIGIICFFIAIFLIPYILIKEHHFKIKSLKITSNYLELKIEDKIMNFIDFNNITKLAIIKIGWTYVYYIYYLEQDKKKILGLSKHQGIAETDLIKMFDIIKKNVDLTKIEIIKE